MLDKHVADAQPSSEDTQSSETNTQTAGTANAGQSKQSDDPKKLGTRGIKGALEKARRAKFAQAEAVREAETLRLENERLKQQNANREYDSEPLTHDRIQESVAAAMQEQFTKQQRNSEINAVKERADMIELTALIKEHPSAAKYLDEIADEVASLPAGDKTPFSKIYFQVLGRHTNEVPSVSKDLSGSGIGGESNVAEPNDLDDIKKMTQKDRLKFLKSRESEL